MCEQDGWQEGLYWDTAEPFHHVRAAKDEDAGLVLIVGGEDHNTGIKPSEYEVCTCTHLSNVYLSVAAACAC